MQPKVRPLPSPALGRVPQVAANGDQLERPVRCHTFPLAWGPPITQNRASLLGVMFTDGSDSSEPPPLSQELINGELSDATPK